MALSFIASTTGRTTLTMPTHQSGDLLLMFAYRDGSRTAPTIPGGWTAITAAVGSSNTNWAGAYYKIAASSGETSGTWTSATTLVAHTYRSDQGGAPSVGAAATTGGSSATVSYPAITLQESSGTSWVPRFVGHRTPSASGVTTPPTGYTLRQSAVDTTDSCASFDSNGGVSVNPTSQNVATGATASGFRTITVEIKDYVAPPPPAPWVQLAQGDSFSGGTGTFSGAVTLGNTIVLLVGQWNATNSGVPTVSDNLSNTYTRVTPVTPTPGEGMSYSIFYAPITNAGTPTITVTGVGSYFMVMNQRWVAGEFAGALVPEQIAVASGTYGVSLPASVTLGPTGSLTTANNLVIGGYVAGNETPPATIDATSPSNFTTMRVDNGAQTPFDTGFIGSARIIASSSAQTAVWGFSGGSEAYFEAGMVVFRIPSGGVVKKRRSTIIINFS